MVRQENRPWGKHVPFWLCKLCRREFSKWPDARSHLWEEHNEKVVKILGDKMIPEVMLLDKGLREEK